MGGNGDYNKNAFRFLHADVEPTGEVPGNHHTGILLGSSQILTA